MSLLFHGVILPEGHPGRGRVVSLLRALLDLGSTKKVHCGGATREQLGAREEILRELARSRERQEVGDTATN